MNIYQIPPKKNYADFQDISLLLLFTFYDLRRHLEAIIWHPKSAADVARKAVYATTL